MNTLKKLIYIFISAVIIAGICGVGVYSEGYFEINEEDNSIFFSEVSNIDRIKDYGEFDEIIIFDSKLDNLDALKGIKVRSLWLKNTEIADNRIVLPEGIEELSMNEIHNVEFTADRRVDLKELYIEGCDFKCIDSCAGFVDNLRILTIIDCNLRSLEGVERFKGLKTFSATRCGIDSIHELKDLNELERVTLEETYVSNLSPLKNKNINYLSIVNSEYINDLSVITTMPRLTLLDTYNCEMAFTRDILDYIYNDSQIQLQFRRGDVYYADENIKKVLYEYVETREKIEKIADGLHLEKLSDREKIRIAVKYIVSHMEYDYDALEDDSILGEYGDSPISDALNRKGVCNNYTRILSAVLNFAGIKCYSVQNAAATQEEFDADPDNADFAHICNMVNLEGELYWIDATWIDADDINWETYDFYSNYCYMAKYSDLRFLDMHHFSKMIPNCLYCKLNNLEYESPDDEILPEYISPEAPDNPTKPSKPAENDGKLVRTVIIYSAAALLAIICVCVLISKCRKNRTGVLNASQEDTENRQI